MKNNLLDLILLEVLRPGYRGLETWHSRLDPEAFSLEHGEVLFLSNFAETNFLGLFQRLCEDISNQWKGEGREDAQIANLAREVLDQLTVMQAFSLEEFCFNLAQAEVESRRNPAIRLVVIDGLNLYLTEGLAEIKNHLAGKRSKKQIDPLEEQLMKRLKSLQAVSKAKIVFTVFEVPSKRNVMVTQRGETWGESEGQLRYAEHPRMSRDSYPQDESFYSDKVFLADKIMLENLRFPQKDSGKFISSICLLSRGLHQDIYARAEQEITMKRELQRIEQRNSKDQRNSKEEKIVEEPLEEPLDGMLIYSEARNQFMYMTAEVLDYTLEEVNLN